MEKIWIVKAGGELLGAPAIQKLILSDIFKLNKRVRVIFVHGGGPQIKKELEDRRIFLPKINGRRVTSHFAMSIVEQVLSGRLNKNLSSALSQMGCVAAGISGRDGKVMVGKPIKGMGRSALPSQINTQLINGFLKSKIMPVISTIGTDIKGAPVNINADDAASAIAVKLKAQRLIFLTDVSGVKDSFGKTMPKLTPQKIRRLIKEGIIKGGMVPKVQSAIKALSEGVGEVDIVNGNSGVKIEKGTRIVKK